MEQKTFIIGFVGHRNSGKTTSAKFLEEEYGAFVIRHSAILEEVLGVLRLDPRPRGNCAMTFRGLADQFGNEVLTHRVIADAQRVIGDGRRIVVIEGIRNLDEVSAYREQLGEAFTLVSIRATREVCWERRNKADGRPGEAEMTLEQFLAIDRRNDVAIEMILPVADHLIVNNGVNYSRLHEQIKEILAKLGAIAPA